MGFPNYNYKHKYIQVQGRVRETLKRDGRLQRLMTQIRISIIHSFCGTFKRENELARELPQRLPGNNVETRGIVSIVKA